MAYWWAIGTTGTSTPARRPISWLYMPAAMTTISHSIRPRSVSTPVTWRRPARSTTSMAVTLRAGRHLHATRPGAGGERHRQVRRVELSVGRQVDGAEDAVRVEQPVEQLARRAPCSPARAADRTSPPSRPGGAAPRGAPATTPGAASRPPSIPDRDPSRRAGAGTARCRTSSSASTSPSCGAGRPGRPSGTSSRTSAGRARRRRCPSSRARPGGRRRWRRRRHRR